MKYLVVLFSLALAFQQEENASANVPFMDIEFTPGKHAITYRIHFELFKKDAPVTCLNFETILAGKTKKKNRRMAYKDTIFHRIIKNFMMQGGDFEHGDGTGGYYSLDPKIDKFKDEKFVHKHHAPGMLSMANAGPNTNGSQFFITFVPTPHLDGKHVVFGRVVKEDLKKILEIAKVATNEYDKPRKDVKIVNCGFTSRQLNIL